MAVMNRAVASPGGSILPRDAQFQSDLSYVLNLLSLYAQIPTAPPDTFDHKLSRKPSFVGPDKMFEIYTFWSDAQCRF